MAATTGFRTLYPAIIPPGSTHVDNVFTLFSMNTTELVGAGTFLSSFLIDFMIRSTGTGHLRGANISGLPFVKHGTSHLDRASRLWLRLNCLTRAYAPLWEDITGEPWTMNTPLRNAQQRWHAQNTIDVIVAHSLGISINELCMIYRTQFPVMRRYDQENLYDSNGRKIPTDIVKQHNKLPEGTLLTKEQRTWQHPQSTITYTFEYPFNPLNRETNLQQTHNKLYG